MLFFYGFATYWQSDGYKIQVKLWGIITLRNTAICVKSACILHHFMVWFDANSSMTCVKSQRIMNEITHKELWKSKITPVFSSVFLCLGIFWNVKNHITIFTESKPFYRHDTLKHIHITENIKIRWCRYPTSLSHFEMLKNRVKSSLSSYM